MCPYTRGWLTYQEKLFLPLPAPNSYEQLHDWGWDCASSSPLHPTILVWGVLAQVLCLMPHPLCFLRISCTVVSRRHCVLVVSHNFQFIHSFLSLSLNDLLALDIIFSFLLRQHFCIIWGLLIYIFNNCVLNRKPTAR